MDGYSNSQRYPGIASGINHETCPSSLAGISKPKTYELAHTRGFPVVKFGKALRVPRDAFLHWLANQVGSEERRGDGQA